MHLNRSNKLISWSSINSTNKAIMNSHHHHHARLILKNIFQSAISRSAKLTGFPMINIITPTSAWSSVHLNTMVMTRILGKRCMKHFVSLKMKWQCNRCEPDTDFRCWGKALLLMSSFYTERRRERYRLAATRGLAGSVRCLFSVEQMTTSLLLSEKLSLSCWWRRGQSEAQAEKICYIYANNEHNPITTTR